MSQRCLFVGLFGTFLLSGCAHKPPPAAPPVPEVSVSVPIEREITDYEDFTGRTDAVYSVDIRARVTGYLVKVNFKDGDLVRENDVLYEIDPRPYQAELDRSKGQVEKLEGQKKLLQIQVDRYTKLVAKGAASQQELDTYIGQQAENFGGLAAAKSQVIYADLNLQFCTIKSPISGQISRTFFQIGNLINQDSTLLTTVVSVDPMYAYFTVEEATYLRLHKLMEEGRVKSLKEKKVEVLMGLADDVERKFPYRGTLDFVNNIVDPLTGTLSVRGVFPNPKSLLKPGLFTRVRVPVGERHKGLLVTERAIGTDQGQKFLYIVDDQNKVQYRRVKLGLVFDGLRAIDEGLKPRERVIVNGLQRVRPNIEVKVEMVDMASQPAAGGEAKPAVAKPETGKTAPAK